MSIATGKGDEGMTRLFSGERVSKTHMRPACYGDMDEASSWLGLAKALATRPEIRPVLHHVQETLLRLGHELATDLSRVEQVPQRISAEDVAWLDGCVAALEAVLPRPEGFVIAGTTAAHGALHVARTVVRRTERGAVALSEAGLLDNAELRRYLNRLSDLVWLLAEYEVATGVTVAGEAWPFRVDSGGVTPSSTDSDLNSY